MKRELVTTRKRFCPYCNYPTHLDDSIEDAMGRIHVCEREPSIKVDCALINGDIEFTFQCFRCDGLWTEAVSKQNSLQALDEAC